jgi:Fe(3+) dicitrate transport protein
MLFQRAHFAVTLVTSTSLLLIFCPWTASAQIAPPDTTKKPTDVGTVVIRATKPLHVIGHLQDIEGSVIYAGKKTEVLVMDSLRANMAQDVERQILGRVPGANFSETEGAGFPSNGVGFRGLDPTQSIEVNTRQNGIGIAADLYGYPETYYTPPSEALSRIEVVRGAGSLAFGPQFGGSINYVVRDGSSFSRPTVFSAQTAGSYGLFNSFNSLGGRSGQWSYYTFVHARTDDGWRPNNDSRQTAFYGSAAYSSSDRFRITVEYTAFRNRIHMPGGLSDEQFAANPRASYRSRNWLASPWNLGAIKATYAFSPAVHLETVLSSMYSQRYLVWRNEDGGPQELDSIDPQTGTYVPREVETETFRNATLENRLRVEHRLFGISSTLATGVRGFLGSLERFEGGPGSTGTDFDMKLYGGTWERALKFGTTNVAAFAEELVRVTERLSITPGIRYEFVRSTSEGYTDVDSAFTPRRYSYPLLGIGGQYAVSGSSQLYGNVSGAYRPIPYASIVPFGSIVHVDPNLKASHGYNADFGWRGIASDVIKFDLSAFYLSYRDRIGTRTVDNPDGSFSETANIGNSVHRGAEVYVELDPIARQSQSRNANFDIFTSLAYVDARYVSGRFRGNRVEQAPRVLARVGLTGSIAGFTSTLQTSYTSSSFGDANNSALPIDDAVAGIVPSYAILDWSGAARLGNRVKLTFGVNNIANARYFTKRTGEYPGPGILAGMGRRAYLGLHAAL